MNYTAPNPARRGLPAGLLVAGFAGCQGHCVDHQTAAQFKTDPRKVFTELSSLFAHFFSSQCGESKMKLAHEILEAASNGQREVREPCRRISFSLIAASCLKRSRRESQLALSTGVSEHHKKKKKKKGIISNLTGRKVLRFSPCIRGLNTQLFRKANVTARIYNHLNGK